MEVEKWPYILVMMIKLGNQCRATLLNRCHRRCIRRILHLADALADRSGGRQVFKILNIWFARNPDCKGVPLNKPDKPEPLTILYDGACPLCQREIAHAKRLAEKRKDSALCFVDISPGGDNAATVATDRAKLLARFHVERADGSRLDGAAAFVAMWSRLPGWRWLAWLAQIPGVLALFELVYRGFLYVRPWLQRLARGTGSRS